MKELYVPVFMPLEHKIVTLSNNELFHTTLPEKSSPETIARRFAASHLGLNAIKAVGPVSYQEISGYTVHTAIDQPYELHPDHRFIVKVQDVDEYLSSYYTSPVDAALVEQAITRLPYPRRLV